MPSVIIRGTDKAQGAIDIATDPISRAIVKISSNHYHNHLGKLFSLSHYFSSIDTDGYGRIRFTTPSDKYIHAVFFSDSTLGLLRTVYRDPGFTHNVSNVIASINHNENSSNSDPLTQACHTPSGSGAGDIFVKPTPSGSEGHFTAAGSKNRNENERILKLSTTYLIEAQSFVDSNKVTLGMVFYYKDVDE